MDAIAPVAGSLIAVAFTPGVSGELLLRSFITGCETGLLLDAVVANAPSRVSLSGLSSGPLAVVATAAGVAHLLGLEGVALSSAFGIAASSTLGSAFAAEPAWQAGRAAANGTLAALLAAEGMTGPATALEHPRGLFATVLGITEVDELEPEPFGSVIRSLVPSVVPARERNALASLREVADASGVIRSVVPGRVS